jgi:hypothetical protein
MNLRKSVLGLMAAPLLLAGCGNANPFQAQLPTAADTFTLFALTGTPPAYPSGLNTYSRLPTRVDGSASFDLAFDIDTAGNVVVYPVKLIVSSISGDRTIGLKRVAGTFDAITSAPTGTYQGDSAVVLTVGENVVVEANRGASGDVCYLNLSPNIYSKIQISSVDLATRTIVIQSVVDPNCGFRSLAAGIPAK